MNVSMRMVLVAKKYGVPQTVSRMVLPLLMTCGFAASGATTYLTYTWKGGEKGIWDDGNNWESSDPEEYPYPLSGNAYASAVTFTNSAEVTCDGEAIYFSGVTVSDGCKVSIDTLGDEDRMWAVADADGKMVFDVGEGAELSLCGKKSSTVHAVSKKPFLKTGKGLLKMRCSIGSSTYPFSKVEVREGILKVDDKSIRTESGVEVHSGAAFYASKLRMDGSETVNIQEGGVAEIASFD
jgi:hypothetical protein